MSNILIWVINHAYDRSKIKFRHYPSSGLILMKSIQDPRYLEVIIRLRQFRKSIGMTQSELSRRIGKPQSYVSKVEKCERRIDLVEALTLCNALGIKLETIVPTELKTFFQ